MNSKIIIILISLFSITLAAQGSTAVQCLTSCSDGNCGNAGSTGNWKSDGNGGCLVTECTLLTQKVSSKSCVSCNSSLKPATIYPNADSSKCVATNCDQINTLKQWTDVLCGDCYSSGYTSKDDKSGCEAPVSNSKVLAISLAFLAALLI